MNDARVAQFQTQQWLEGERLLRRFEREWADGQAPTLRDYLPADDQTRLGVVFELIVMDLELRCDASQRIPLGSYLSEFPELLQSPGLVFDLFKAEQNLYPGDSIHRENELLERYPQLRSGWKSVHGENLFETQMHRRPASTAGRFSKANLSLPTSETSDCNLPGFRPVRLIGRGATGIVVEAEQLNLGRLVALKIFNTSTMDQNRWARFRFEAEIAASLKHPHIVTLHSFGEHDNRPYLAFELIRGTTLEECWARNLPDPRQVAVAVEVLARATQFAHERGIVHRDLKPGNILVEEKPNDTGAQSDVAMAMKSQLKIADFGLAKGLDLLESSTMTGEVLGTPAYMSPEQACGDSKHVGATTDVYALGAILYRGLTGIPPFLGLNPVDTLALIRWRDVVAPRQLQATIPIDLDTICLKCLNKDPQSRYSSAMDLSDDLRRFLDGYPILARRTSMAGKLLMSCRRRPLVAIWSLLTICILVLGVTSVLSQWRIATQALARANQREAERLYSLVDSLENATSATASSALAAVRSERPDIDSYLKERETSASSNIAHRIHLALLDDEPDRLKSLSVSMLQANPREFVFLRNEIHRTLSRLGSPARHNYQSSMLALSAQQEPSSQNRFHSLLALYEPDDDQFAKRHGPEIVRFLLNANPLDIQIYYVALEPLNPSITDSLDACMRDNSQAADARNLAATLLSDAHRDNSQLLLRSLLDCNDEQFPIVFEKLKLHGEQVLQPLKIALQTPFASAGAMEELDRNLVRQCNAALALFGLGQPNEVWPLLEFSPTPDLRTYLIHRLPLVCTTADPIHARLTVESDPSIRRALIHALGELPRYKTQLQTDPKLLETLVQIYENDPDAGTHASVRWLLKKTGHEQHVMDSDKRLVAEEIPIDRDWYVNFHGHNMAIIRGPVEFSMVVEQPGQVQSIDDMQCRKRIGRTWAIGTTEVSLPDFQKFQPNRECHPVYCPDPRGSLHGVQWYEAARYCRWLSEQEGIPEEQMCYPPVAEIHEGMRMPDNYLLRTGYRLPTEAEWDYACRSGTTGSYSFGENPRFIDHYGWTLFSAAHRVHPGELLKPNDLGLFDMHGNLAEWCQNTIAFNSDSTNTMEDKEENRPVVNTKPFRVTRGGSFSDSIRLVRSTYRKDAFPGFNGYSIGFRLARTLEQP